MKYGVFAVFDVKAGAYWQPFYAVNPSVARRSFMDLVADEQSPASRHPGDYEVRHVGDFDDLSGEVKGIDPVPLLGGVEAYHMGLTEALQVENLDGSKRRKSA